MTQKCPRLLRLHIEQQSILMCLFLNMHISYKYKYYIYSIHDDNNNHNHHIFIWNIDAKCLRKKMRSPHCWPLFSPRYAYIYILFYNYCHQYYVYIFAIWWKPNIASIIKWCRMNKKKVEILIHFVCVCVWVIFFLICHVYLYSISMHFDEKKERHRKK